MTETEAAFALGDSFIRYLSAKRADALLARKGVATAIIAICDDAPQKYNDEEAKRVADEMTAAQAALEAATKDYVAVRPQSVPTQVGVALDAEQASALKSVDLVASWGLRL